MFRGVVWCGLFAYAVQAEAWWPMILIGVGVLCVWLSGAYW